MLTPSYYHTLRKRVQKNRSILRLRCQRYDCRLYRMDDSIDALKRSRKGEKYERLRKNDTASANEDY